MLNKSAKKNNTQFRIVYSEERPLDADIERSKILLRYTAWICILWGEKKNFRIYEKYLSVFGNIFIWNSWKNPGFIYNSTGLALNDLKNILYINPIFSIFNLPKKPKFHKYRPSKKYVTKILKISSFKNTWLHYISSKILF